MNKNQMTAVFYGLIGITASLFLSIVFYWSLRLNSSISTLIAETGPVTLYFWPYVLLTFGIIILFGVNIALLVYRFRKWGLPNFKSQAGGLGLGAIVGTAASACPVCGSLLLSAVGITGGLAVFPLQGLELKALSFILMALPIVLTRRELKTLECKDETCPTPHDASFQEKDRPWMVRLAVLLIFFALIGWSMLKTDPVLAKFLNTNTSYAVGASTSDYKLYYEVLQKVVPQNGFQSKIILGDSIVKLVESGVIDKEKFKAIYKNRGGLLELKNILDKPSNEPILLTRHNANVYINLLWPLGLANYMSTNKESPVNGSSLFNFASTGGWNLGKEENGGVYFNKFNIVQLTPQQEELVVKVAKNTYRPCCDNSTFFQDCNHGSGLLGVLQLGASQGLSEEELFREALAFNSFWFPDTYLQTALYFKLIKQTDWEDVDPRVVMGYNYSSVSQWIKNVQIEVAKIKNLIPQAQGGGGCGI